MFNSIEIPDSDDEVSEPASEKAKSITSSSETTDPSPEKPKEMPDTSSTSKSTEASTSTSNATVNQLESTAQIRHRSRKTQHTVRNASEIDMQFVSVPAAKVMRKIPRDPLEQRLNDPDGIKSVVNNMLDSEEIQGIIQRIANERVRCNFLLATYQIPDISFTLNTHPDMLKHQYRERLKKRKQNVENATETPPQQ